MLMAIEVPERIQKLPSEYREIYDEFIMPVDTNIQLSSVILSDENKEKVKAFLMELQYRDRLYEYGLEPMNRLLLYGASGCGKTYLTKALSNHLGYTMIYIDIAKSLSDDTVSKNISRIFKLTDYLGDCILMLDECDSIAWQRDTGNSDTGTIRRATNTIFQYLDQMNHSNVFVAATNMLHRLDAAFERRFNLKLRFNRPELDIKDAIKRFIKEKFVIIDDVDPDIEAIVAREAKRNIKLSYYELQGLVERAMKRAVIRGTNEMKTSELFRDLASSMNLKIDFGTENDPEEIFHNKNSY